MSEPAIEVRDLSKSYGSLEAVKGISFTIARGEVYAMLGPNGAGKTTTVEILEGYRDRDGGDVHVLGHDPAANERSYKERIGIVLQETGIQRYLTVEEVIEQYRCFYPDPLPIDEIIEVVGLQEKRKERTQRLSGGQQRRLDVAIGLAGNPELLFLDEPTTGFDPSARRGAWQMIQNLQSLGKTVFLTTHYMDEASALADRVAIIAGGKIIAEGAPSELSAGRERETVIRFTLDEGAPALPPAVADKATRSGGLVEIATEDPTRLLHEITGWAIKNEIDLTGLSVQRPTLEDVYLELTHEAQAVTV